MFEYKIGSTYEASPIKGEAVQKDVCLHDINQTIADHKEYSIYIYTYILNVFPLLSRVIYFLIVNIYVCRDVCKSLVLYDMRRANTIYRK